VPRIEAEYVQQWRVRIERQTLDPGWPDIYLSGRGLVRTDTIIAVYQPGRERPVTVYASGRLPPAQNTHIGQRVNMPYTSSPPEWVLALLALAPPSPWESL
jgi:hypothetical protein